MSPEPPRLHQIREVFTQAVELEGAQREEYLAHACADNSDLRREVDSLLAADAVTEGLVDQPLFDLHPASPQSSLQASPVGRRIGSYEILREIGRGGLGVVYLAARLEFEQRVALKVIKRGMDTEEVVRRFHRERQILANLEHPQIARLFDGGSTEDGLPYFVMELVEGERLDHYCVAEELSVPERLRLFLQVCSAVDFAHRSLVVHRDLKPSNILVSDGSPKLLDFGIAKLLTPEEAPQSNLTRLGSTPMTPKYASPEQARGEVVTTASDVYSLGLILHQILTGRLPARLKGQGVTLQKSELNRDLKSIVRKALREEPEQRYRSAEQLAEDLRRHLDGLPVLAREGALLYRTGRFVKRHRWPLVAALVLLLLAMAGETVRRESARKVARAEFTQRLAAERAEEAHRQAEIRSDLLLNLFGASDLQHEEGFTVLELLARGQEKIRGNLQGEPLATQLEIMGRLYGDLGDGEEARELLEEVLQLRRELYQGDHPLLARVLNNLAARHDLAGEYEQAGNLYQESLEMRKRLGQEGLDLVKVMSNLASIQMTRGEYSGAEGLYRDVLAIRQRAHGDRDPAVATSLRSLGILLYLRGEPERAEPLLEQALEIRHHHFGAEDTRVAAVESSLGRVFLAQGRLGEAEGLLRRVLSTRQRLLGEDHPHVALTKRDLAAVLVEGPTTPAQLAAVEGLLGEALVVLRKWKPEGSWEFADAESLWGFLRMKQGRFQEAEPFLIRGYETLLELRGEQAVYTRAALRRLRGFYAAWGKPVPSLWGSTTKK